MDFLLSGLFLSIIISNIHFSTGQTDFRDYYCGLTGNYTPDSQYKLDIDEVLSSSFLSTDNGFGFYNSSSGEVKAAAFCLGYIEPNKCQRCVDDATRRLRQLCPSQFEAFGRYDTCLIRYSNRTMRNLEGNVFYWSLENVSDSSYDQWNKSVATLLKTLQTEAAGGGNLRKYASENLTVSDSLKIYRIMQCTPDFSETDCDECLVNAKSLVRFIPKSLGFAIFTPNCLIRYEKYLFYNSTWFAPPPIQSQAPSPFLALSPLGDTPDLAASPSGNTKRINIGAIVVVLVAFVVIVMVIGFFIFRRRQKLKRHAGPFVPEFHMGFDDNSPEGSKHEREDEDAGEMNSFNLSTILVATNNFSLDNKLGEGGFGPVYKGKLVDGKEIAVKRLSRNSRQGLVEFKTEVQLIIKLQHKNLV